MVKENRNGFAFRLAYCLKARIALYPLPGRNRNHDAMERFLRAALST